MKKEKADSWSSIVTKDKNFIARKTVGYSVFVQGTVVPTRYKEAFLNNLSSELPKGSSVQIKLVINDVEYDSKIDNPNSKGRNDDLVRIMFGKEFKEELSKKLKISYDYIMENKDTNSKAQVLLPPEYEEYIDFYIGSQKDEFIVNFITRNNIIVHKEDNNYNEINTKDKVIEDEIVNMTKLPEAADENVNVNILESFFEDISNGEDIYWFNSIIDEIMIGNVSISFKNVVIGIISEIWDIILRYDLNLGSDNKFKKIIPEIKNKYFNNKGLDKNAIYNELICLYDVDFDNMLSGFYEYLPYRLLKPFFKQDLQGISSESEINKKIEELTIDNFTAIYEINKKDKYIYIHDNWIKYIYDNEVILKQWIKEKKRRFLEYKNKDKLELIDKIFKKYELEEAGKNGNESFEIIYSENTLETLKKIHSYIKSQGFTYDFSLIKNLYLSLKTKPFVILSGISGTGKSKLIQLFAEALGSTCENKMFNLVPVKPEWSDSSDLLGFRNLEGKFMPGIIISIAKRAIDNPEVPYFVCLDEMNLARVEYYFSDILSVMETRKFVNNHIVSSYMLDNVIFGDDNKAREVYGKVYFPENLYIIGTVNMDETTFPFSKKVLDRANVIEFNSVNLSYSFDDFEEELQINTLDNSIYHNNFLKSDFLKISECREYKDIALKTIDELIKINNILERYNAHFGYRVRDEIVFYVIYAVKENLMEFEEAMDNAVFSKILPKMGGSSTETCEILFDLFELFTEYKIENRQYLENADMEYMNRAIVNNIAVGVHNPEYEFIKYEFTCRKLLYMIKRFTNDSFTTFYM